MLPFSCSSCCKGEPGEGGSKSYRQVEQAEPVYSEPGDPRPSTTAAPYTFPADAQLLHREGAEYAEPDPNGTLGMAARTTTPPPLPDSPPPGSPTAVSFPPAAGFPPEEAPPKPMRTFPRPSKESKSKKGDAGGEEYDHITTGGKSNLKSPAGRDGQNNIIGENGGDQGGGKKEENFYNRLDHGDDYSQAGTKPKTIVKDNVYDRTS